MTRRTLAVVLLAAFAAGPGLRTHCLLSCSPIEHAAAPKSCHDESGQGPAVKVHHGCPGDAGAVALVVKRADVVSSAVSQPVQAIALGFGPGPVADPIVATDRAAPRPPLSTVSVPLRV